MYSLEITSILKKNKIKVGDSVTVEKAGEKSEGILMPRIESGNPNVLIIKLASGYNIGIEFDKETAIEKTGAGKKVREAPQVEIPNDAGKKNILILHTGGTIASKVDYRTGGVVASYSPEEIVKMLPELKEIANVRTEIISNMQSEDMNFKHHLVIARAIRDAVENGKINKIDGIIVTHGTDTLHYTSASLAFQLQNPPIPILLVGAQRSSDRPSSDAAFNLISAAFFICNSSFKGIGVCMHETINDTTALIHSPTKVRKCHTSRRDAFRTVNGLPIARVDYKNKTIEIIKKETESREDEGNGKFQLFDKLEEKVALIKTYPNFDPKIIEFFTKQGYKGIVFEGTGLGHLPARETDEFTKSNAKVFKNLEKFIATGGIAAIASQTIFGRVNLNVYSPQRRLQEIGCISCADMTSETAFIKLAWLLGNFDAKTAKELMGKNLRGEMCKRTTD